MATGAAGDGLIWGMFEACISGSDMSIQRRPYHRNCSCALHKSRGTCSHAPSRATVSYPIRRTWSEGCLTMMAAPSPTSSPCSSPAVAPADAGRTQAKLAFFHNEE
ncbi:hypothetical protein NMG60_11005147 [Bertholletia excelsa]